MENEVYFDSQDIEQNRKAVKVSAILQIFIPILFVIPLICCQGSPYGKFYTNQGLLLFLMKIIAGAVAGIPLIGGLACAVIGCASLIFSIMNAVNASKGVQRAIPIIGDKIQIIK